MKIYLTFILINDYRFPVPPPPYGIDVHTNKHQLDLIENMLDKKLAAHIDIGNSFNIKRNNESPGNANIKINVIKPPTINTIKSVNLNKLNIN